MATWYDTGTVAVTNNSATVTGSGTAWVANVLVGEAFIGPDGRTYEITDVGSNTSMTIAPNYLGTSQSGQAYTIIPVRGIDRQNQSLLTELITNYQSVVLGIGAGLFPDGSAATPAFRFANDQDTGFYRLANNAIGVSLGGALGITIGSSGWLGLGVSPTAPFAAKIADAGAATVGMSIINGADSDRGARLWVGTSGPMLDTNSGVMPLRFGVDNTEHMRIGTNGNVGIGTASPTFPLHVVGTSIWESACFQNTNSGSGANATFINGMGNRWDIGLRGDSETFAIRRTADGNTLNVVFVQSNQFSPGIDNAQSLGSGSFRWSVVYAGTGTINTSDERKKHWRGELNAAELRAAKRIIGELGIYQWNDAVAEKGEENARLHFGVRAQRVFAIMENEGLDWGRYAWACYDQWEEQTEPVMEEITVTKTRTVTRPSETLDEETGEPIMVEIEESYQETEMQPTGETRVTLEAGDRYGVRPDQLAFWLIAAQAAMQADLEARIAALEAA